MDEKPLLVRMDAALHEAVFKAAAGQDRSMASFVREALREKVGQVRVGREVAGVTPAVTKASRPTFPANPKGCQHPVGRRIGDSCGACGAKA